MYSKTLTTRATPAVVAAICAAAVTFVARDDAHQVDDRPLGDDLDVLARELVGFDEARLHLRRDVAVVAARAKIGRRADDHVVLDRLHALGPACDLDQVPANRVVRHLAGEQHRGVVAGHVEVDLVVAVARAGGRRDLELDRLVVDLRAGRAAVGGDHRRGADAGTTATPTQPGSAGRTSAAQSAATSAVPRNRGRRPGHSSSPSSALSMASHRQWIISRWTSWMRAVRSCGTPDVDVAVGKHVADPAAALAGQRHDAHVALVRGVDRGDHVGRVARGRDREQHVAARRRARAPAWRTPARTNSRWRSRSGSRCRWTARSPAARDARARSARSSRRRSAARRRPSRRCRRRGSCRRPAGIR